MDIRKRIYFHCIDVPLFYVLFSSLRIINYNCFQLIELGGGQLLVREPKNETVIETQTVPYHASPESKLSHCSHYIVHRAKEAKATMINSRLCNVSFTWIIDSCANFQLIEPA